MFRAPSTPGRAAILTAAVITTMSMASACSSQSSTPTPTGSSPAQSTIPDPIPKGPAPTVAKDATLAASVPASVRGTGKLTIATDPNYAPLAFNPASPQGVDIDLATATSQLLGLTPELVAVPFDSLNASVTSLKENLAWSATTVTAERAAQVDFVTYYLSGIAWLEKTGSDFTPESPCGATVAVGVRGSVMDAVVKQIKQKCQLAGLLPISIVRAAGQTKAAELVLTGQAEVTLADTPVINSLIARTNGQLEQADSAREIAPLGVVLPKGSPLGPVVRNAIQKLIDGGQYQQILDRWQIPQGAIKASVLNPTP